MYYRISILIIIICAIFTLSLEAKLPPTSLKKIEVFSLKTGIKVKIALTGSFKYRHFCLTGRRNLPKIVVDLQPVYLPKGMKNVFTYKDPRIKKIRVAQYNKKTVRIVLYPSKVYSYDVKKIKKYLVLNIKSPLKNSQRKKLVKSAICIRSVKILYPPPQGLKILIEASKKPHYKDFVLPAISHKNLPPRLVIDLWPAYLPKGAGKTPRISHPLVSKLRLAQFNKKTVRIVLYLKTTKIPYNISFTNNRLVITAFNIEKPSVSLPQILGLKVGKIVIDPGHGGKDPGAIGYKGLKEKEITLRVAKLLKRKLETQLGCKVILTRNNDKFLSLEERAELANKLNADFFISIHCNACASRRLQGIETYFVGLTNDAHALAVASRENMPVQRRMGELEKILLDLLVKAKVKESAYLAAEIQQEVIKQLKYRGFNPVVNLGVKQAPFYVLIGTKMPAVLVEIGFIDHPKEARRLRNPNYLETIANGIAKGIRDYVSMIEAAYEYKASGG